LGDFGAKASVPGYDINHVTDFLMSFNSSWPLLKIEHSAVATITLNATPQTIYTHNLGYPPAYFFLSGGIFQEYGDVRHIGVNNTILGYDGLNPVGGTYTFRYYVCRLPLTQNFTAPIIGDSQIQTAISRDYGIKVAKPGKSTSSTDLRDFALNTSSRSLMVHKVDYGPLTPDGGDYTRTVSHGLIYTPFAFCYLKYGTGLSGYDPDYHYINPGPQGVQDAWHTLDSSNMYIFENGTFATAGADATMVALKDPFAKDTVNVSFP
jgi:hypothetical protein